MSVCWYDVWHKGEIVFQKDMKNDVQDFLRDKPRLADYSIVEYVQTVNTSDYLVYWVGNGVEWGLK